MASYFIVVECLTYLFALYLLFSKKDLAIIYLPVVFFASNLVEPTFSAFIHYGMIGLLLLACAIKHITFFRFNFFALLIFVYFALLLTRVTDIVEIRSHVFAVLCLFVSIPLIAAIYTTHPEQTIFNELTKSATIVLVLFIVNVFFCTINNYSPHNMYGITRGFLYGNIYGAGFNILSIAVFVVTLKLIQTRQPIYIVLLLVALVLIVLSLRRTVMLLSLAGGAIAFLSLLTQKEAKRFLFLATIIIAAGYTIYSSTAFQEEFSERYELRNLSERDMAEEKRFIEYELIYDDMFEQKDYSPWIGYELLNSAGNYGQGIFELRTLHADLPSIAHSSGLIGVALYLLMMFSAFVRNARRAYTGLDKLILFFGFLSFVVYTITGRFTEASSMILLFLVINMPLAVRQPLVVVQKAEPEEPPTLVPATFAGA